MLRPIPADFAEMAGKMSVRKLKVHYKCGEIAVRRWMKETGSKGFRAQRLEPPSDFAQIAPTMTMTELEKHYGVRHGKVKIWSQETGIKIKRNGLRPPPDGFTVDAASMTRTDMMRQYKADWNTISRWLQETDVEPARYISTPPPRHSRGFVFKGHGANPKALDLRQKTLYDEAADTLRRERFVVYRCDDRGRFDERGALWRRGNSIMTGAELLEKAARYASRAA